MFSRVPCISQDYVIRLSDEASLVELAEAVYSYYRRVGDDRSAAQVALLHVEHLYYKHDTIAAAVQRAHVFTKTWGRHADLHPGCSGRIEDPKANRDSARFHPASYLGNPTVDAPVGNPSAKLEELCHFIFKHGNEKSKTRALLCLVYHHALHDRYYRARDLFLMSHIQDTIDKVEIGTQILYNRALVTLGLAAFRQGLVVKAHECLAQICSGRVKDMLAQGQARGFDRDPDQVKLEKRRLVPYHMHINQDLLECCYLICAMFIELPNFTRPNPSSQVSKFRRHMLSYNRQVFTGPPENIREHVLAASKALLAGDWQQACDYVLGLEVWNLLPGDGGVKVKSFLQDRMKEEAVRTNLVTYGAHYESLSLAHICEMFSIEETRARRIISRMIFNKEIAAAWDFPADTLALYPTEASTLQTLSQQMADKIAVLVESNERLIDPLVNAYNFQDWRVDQSRRGGRGDDENRRRFASWKPNQTGGRGRGRSSGGRGGGGGRSGWGQGRPNVAPGNRAEPSSSRPSWGAA